MYDITVLHEIVNENYLYILAVLFTGLLIARMHFRARVLKESLGLFMRMARTFNLDESEIKVLQTLFKKISVVKPHVLLASPRSFDKMFTKLIITVDKMPHLHSFKSHLMHAYTSIHSKLKNIEMRPNDRRKLPRYSSVDEMYYKTDMDAPSEEGLSYNLSAGGVRFFAKTRIKKGSKIEIGFDKALKQPIVAKVLDVSKKAHVYIARAKFVNIYPTFV